MKNSNKRVKTFLIFIILIPLCFYVLPKAIFYWSVCKGIQDNGRLMDYLFEEYCPAEAVEEWYETLFWEECIKQDQQIPPNMELLISACTDPEVRGVPGGEFLFVNEKKTGEVYLLDLRTEEKKLVPNASLLIERGIFLNSELFWLEGRLSPGDTSYRPHYVLDLTNGQKYELVDLTRGFDAILDNGNLNPDLFSYFTEAEQVFVSYEHNVIIALAPNFRQNLKRSVYFHQSSFGQGNLPENGELLVKLLQDLQVDYKIIDFSTNYAEIPSPTGRYVARKDGIYYAGTDTPLIREYTGTGGVDMSAAFTGWYYDERSIILVLGGSYHKIYPWGKSFPLPSSILKLNLLIP